MWLSQLWLYPSAFTPALAVRSSAGAWLCLPSCVRLLCRLLAVALPLQLCCAGSGCCAQSAGAFLDYSPII